MKSKTKWSALAAATVAIVAAGAGVAAATGGGDDAEQPITGDALDKASAAALEHTGGGTVTDTEVGDEESYYEVEVTLPGGGETDVQLDQDFNVVSSEGEDAGETDD